MSLHAEIEEGINIQISNELGAFYAYLAMVSYLLVCSFSLFQSNYCRRTAVSLPGAAAYFLNQSNEEREHAQKLINYLVTSCFNRY